MMTAPAAGTPRMRSGSLESDGLLEASWSDAEPVSGSYPDGSRCRRRIPGISDDRWGGADDLLERSTAGLECQLDGFVGSLSGERDSEITDHYLAASAWVTPRALTVAESLLGAVLSTLADHASDAGSVELLGSGLGQLFAGGIQVALRDLSSERGFQGGLGSGCHRFLDELLGTLFDALFDALLDALLGSLLDRVIQSDHPHHLHRP